MGISPNFELQFTTPDQLKKGSGGTKLLNELENQNVILIANNDDCQLGGAASYELAITDNPDYYEGRTDSMHRVEFGNAATQANGNSLTAYPVALKPYSQPWLALRDYRTAKKLNEICPNVTYQPIGFAKDNNKTYGITRFEEGVVSFDNILWNERAPSEKEIEWSLGCAAASLVFLHANGYAHGDYQVKNTAYDEALSSRVIDITTARQRNDPLEFIDDIANYAESLGQYGRHQSHVSAEQMRNWFLDDYYDAIPDIYPKNKQQAAAEGLAVVAVHLSEIIEGADN